MKSYILLQQHILTASIFTDKINFATLLLHLAVYLSVQLVRELSSDQFEGESYGKPYLVTVIMYSLKELLTFLKELIFMFQMNI